LSAKRSRIPSTLALLFALTACDGGSGSVTTVDGNGQSVVIAFVAGTDKVTVTLPAATFTDVSLTNFVPMASAPVCLIPGGCEA
jgi:hypothetical protein